MVLITIVMVLLTLWLGGITYVLLKAKKQYDLLTGGANKKDLAGSLDALLREVMTSKKDIAHLIRRCDKIEDESQFHIQKIGLLRFNPFKDTGGDQSFILALIDAQNTGVVISGLYSRTGTRWYAKRVIRGKGIEHDLSQEERKAIEVAKIRE